MKIALIQFSLYKNPLGLLSLATYVKKYGHEPVIVDLSPLSKKNSLRPNLFEKIAEKILNCRPGVIGFSITCNSLPAALLVAKQCKKIAPQISTIFGGPEVSFEEIALLKSFKQIDIIVRGEGEITLRELLDALEEKRPLTNILGITFKEKGTIIRNPDRPLIKDLNKLPFPDFSLLPNLKGHEAVHIEGGRGCPYRCTFCASCKMWKGNFRIKSPQRLAKELKRTYSRFRTGIIINHDHLLINRRWRDKFLSLISGQGLAWACCSRLDVLDEALIKKLKQAGCRGVLIGIESGSPKIQKQIKKNFKLQNLPQILRAFDKYQLFFALTFIVGFPGEGIKELNQTLLMAIKTKLYNYSLAIQIHPLCFLKGSELYNQSKDKFFPREFNKTNFVQLLTGSYAERALVKKHPQIFPSFHYIKHGSFDPEFLEKISILFMFLCNFFPSTTRSLLKSCSLSPYHLGKRIIAYFERNGAKWRLLWEEKASLKYYLPYFKSFLKSNSKSINNLAREMFVNEYEEAFKKRI